MSLRKILVPVDGSAHDEVLLKAAVRAAKPFNAHLAVTFAHRNPEEAATFISAPLSPEAMGVILDANTQIFRAKTKRIRTIMARVAAAEGALVVDAPQHGATVTLAFHEAIGYPPEVIGTLAGLADLAICGAATNAAKIFETDIDLILQRRRPVLVVDSVPEAFHNVAIGWNNTPSAARAISAAMPFLEKARMVQLLCLETATRERFNTGPVTAYLKAHGIETSEVHEVRRDAFANTEVTKLALEHNTDLLVMGAFGHSRVHETLFGGVTNETLRRPLLPVLLAH